MSTSDVVDRVHRLAQGENLGKSNLRVVTADFKVTEPDDDKDGKNERSRPMTIQGRITTSEPHEDPSLGLRIKLAGTWPRLEASMEVETTYHWNSVTPDEDELFAFAEQYGVPSLFNATVGIFAVELRKYGVRITLPPPDLAASVAENFIEHARREVTVREDAST